MLQKCGKGHLYKNDDDCPYCEKKKLTRASKKKTKIKYYVGDVYAGSIEEAKELQAELIEPLSNDKDPILVERVEED